MGAVYLTTNLRLGVPAALKVLHGAAPATPEALERFRREAKVASTVTHPNIVRAADYDVWAGTPWIAMEVLEGESLGARLKRVERLEAHDALTIFEQVVRACLALHSLGIVHRDLKPDNVFLQTLDGGGELVRVLDFGIAKVLKPGAEGGLTGDGAILGTLDYLAPEQAKNSRDTDERTDIWALGVVLYEMLVGTVPFRAGSLLQLIVQLEDSEAPPLRDSLPDVSEGLDALVHDCLRLDPNERPQSCGELLARLESLREAKALPPSGAATQREFGTATAPRPAADTTDSFETRFDVGATQTLRAGPGAKHAAPGTIPRTREQGATQQVRDSELIELHPATPSEARPASNLRLAALTFAVVVVLGALWLLSR